MSGIDADIGVFMLAIIIEAIGADPEGWMWAKTLRSSRMISACAAIPMYGSRSFAGAAVLSFTSNSRIIGTLALSGAWSRIQTTWVPSASAEIVESFDRFRETTIPSE